MASPERKKAMSQMRANLGEVTSRNSSDSACPLRSMAVKSAEEWAQEFKARGGLTELALDEKTIKEVQMSWMLLCAKKGSVGAAEEAVLNALRKADPELAKILYGDQTGSMMQTGSHINDTIQRGTGCAIAGQSDDFMGIFSEILKQGNGKDLPHELFSVGGLDKDQPPEWFLRQFAAQQGVQMQADKLKSKKESKRKTRSRPPEKELPPSVAGQQVLSALEELETSQNRVPEIATTDVGVSNLPIQVTNEADTSKKVDQSLLEQPILSSVTQPTRRRARGSIVSL